jgi:hypothetical protein
MLDVISATTQQQYDSGPTIGSGYGFGSESSAANLEGDFPSDLMRSSKSLF